MESAHGGRNLEILARAGLSVGPAREGISAEDSGGLPRTVVPTARGPMPLASIDGAGVFEAILDDPRLRPGGSAVLLGGADLETLRRTADRLRPGGRILVVEPWPELWAPLLDRCDLAEILGDVSLRVVGDADFTPGILALAQRLRKDRETLGDRAVVVAAGYLGLILAGTRGARPTAPTEAFAEWARALSQTDTINTPSDILEPRRAPRARAVCAAAEGLLIALPGLAHLAAEVRPVEPPSPDRVSVVMLTYRRPDLLARALASLEATWPAPGEGEVVVVDNADDPASAAVVEGRAAAGVLPIRRILGHNSGCAGGRNLGAAAASGDYLFFFDDDVEFAAPGWWKPVASAFALHPRIGCVGGFGVVYRRDEETGEFVQRAWLPGFPLPVHWVSGFAFCVRREAWRAIGGHPSHYWIGCEDVDLGYALRAKGWATVVPQEPIEPLYFVHRIAHVERAEKKENDDRIRGGRVLRARWGPPRRLHDAFSSNAPMPLTPRAVPEDLAAVRAA